MPHSPLAACSPAGWVVSQGEGAGVRRCVPRSPGPALHPRFRLVSFPPPRHPVSSTPLSCPVVSLSCCVVPLLLWYVVSLVVLLPPLLLWWWCGLGSRGPGWVQLGQVVWVVVVVGTRGMVNNVIKKKKGGYVPCRRRPARCGSPCHPAGHHCCCHGGGRRYCRRRHYPWLWVPLCCCW